MCQLFGWRLIQSIATRRSSEKTLNVVSREAIMKTTQDDAEAMAEPLLCEAELIAIRLSSIISESRSIAIMNLEVASMTALAAGLAL
ncbi:hypothetical protein [Methylobacter sp.]|uniref:hypothetical protein n=1 Tax=Methylobacter sp. TaxID=2051955 RepID=UPI00344E36EB